MPVAKLAKGLSGAKHELPFDWNVLLHTPRKENEIHLKVGVK